MRDRRFTLNTMNISKAYIGKRSCEACGNSHVDVWCEKCIRIRYDSSVVSCLADGRRLCFRCFGNANPDLLVLATLDMEE